MQISSFWDVVYFLLNKGTEEQASPNIIDLAIGFSFWVSKIRAFAGTGL